jgi:hypothetical protein
MSDRKFYQIRHNKTGLFATGSNPPKFNQIGKIWNSLNDLKSHLGCILDAAGYNDADIIELRINHVHISSVMNFTNQFEGRRLIKNVKQPLKKSEPVPHKKSNLQEGSSLPNEEKKEEKVMRINKEKIEIQVYSPLNRYLKK